MKKAFYYTDNFKSSLFDKNNEIIFSPRELSRFGKVDLKELIEISKKLKEEGYKTILEWDILMTQSIFQKSVGLLLEAGLSNLQQSFSSIRVQDPGAFFFVREKAPSWPIQLILENGNHNLTGLKKWQELGGEQLERMILSLEIPGKVLKEYIKELNCPVEIMGLGPILLFYTPRELLSPLMENNEGDWRQVFGSSQESPHQGFKIVQNDHGTFMFNPKDHCLIDFLDELVEMGVNTLRYDNRFVTDQKIWDMALNIQDEPLAENISKLKEAYPFPVIRGFFHANKSDVLFKKLKNKNIVRSDESFIGDVVDVNKKNYIGIMIRKNKFILKPGMEIEYRTPDGKIKLSKISNIKNSSLEGLDEATLGQVVFVPHTSGVSIRSAVYLKDL